MIDLIKLEGYFDPINIEDEIHVIGLGAIGSHVATGLIRMRSKEITSMGYR